MRNITITKNTPYHIYNRGNLKQTIFHDPSDYARFLFLILYFQSPQIIPHVSRAVGHFLKHKTFKISEDIIEEIVDTRTVELLNFCIMPNHFHLTIKNLDEHGISKYMHRVSSAYAKYYTSKYETSGHVFQGTYKAKEILTTEQLVYTSAYIHRNPCELSKWQDHPEHYLWSSLSDYSTNRWNKLLKPEMILSAFDHYEDYMHYCSTSGAKTSFG